MLPEGRFHSYPLQDPPKHGLAGAAATATATAAAAGTLRALCGLLGIGGREGHQPSREEGGGRGGGGRCFGGPDFPTGGERRRTSTSQRGPSLRAPACRAAPVTDSWAGPPVAGGRSRRRPASSAWPAAGRAGPEEGRPGAPTNCKRGQRDRRVAGSWDLGFFRRAPGRPGAGPCSGRLKAEFGRRSWAAIPVSRLEASLPGAAEPPSDERQPEMEVCLRSR